MIYDWKTLDAALGVVAVLISFGTMIYTWLTRGARKNTQAIAELKADLEHQEGRIDKIEAKLDALPDREDLHRLDKQLESMRGNIGSIGSALKVLQRSTDRISDYLLNNGGKS